MFDQKKDKEKLEKAITIFLNKKYNDLKKENLRRLYNLFLAIKIITMYIFAFVGFSFIFYHFIMGQPYQCTIFNEIETYPPEYVNTSEQTNYVNYDNKLIECENNLQEYKNNYIELENKTRHKYLKEIFEPLCEELN